MHVGPVYVDVPPVVPVTCTCRDKLMKNHSVLEVDLVHVREYNQDLGDGLENKPAEYLPLVRHMTSHIRTHVFLTP